MTGAFFECDCLNWGKSACLSATVIIFPWNNIQKRLPLPIFVLGKLAKVLLRNFITTHWEHFWHIDTTHWWLHRCPVVCWWRLTTEIAVHINGTQIAIWTHTWCFVTVTRLRWACANVQTRQSLRCQLMRFDTYRTVHRLYLQKCADSPESSLLGWIAQKSPFEAAHEILVQWRRLR